MFKKRLSFCLLAAWISCLVSKFEACAGKEQWEFLSLESDFLWRHAPQERSVNKADSGKRGVVLKFVGGGEKTLDQDVRNGIGKAPEFVFEDQQTVSRLRLAGLAAYLDSKDERLKRKWIPVFRELWGKAMDSRAPERIVTIAELLKKFGERRKLLRRGDTITFTGRNSLGLGLEICPKEIELINNLPNAGLPFDAGSISRAVHSRVSFKNVLKSLDSMASVGFKALKDILAKNPDWASRNTVMEITGPLRLLSIMADSRFGKMSSLKGQMEGKNLLSADDIGIFFEHGKVETTTFALLGSNDLDRIKRGTPIPYVENLGILRCGKTDDEISDLVNQRISVATSGMIESIDLPEDISEEKMALFTTAYFKDRWKFGPFGSARLIFNRADGSKANVGFVDAEGELMYKELTNGDILALIPFKVGGWHYAIHMPRRVPESPQSISFFDSRHFKGTAGALPGFARNVKKGTLYSGRMDSIKFPEFDITANHKDLKDTLGKQFPAIGEKFWKDATINSMTQKARLIVDSKGAEAAAVSGSLCYDCHRPEAPPSLFVDRPHAVAIVEGVKKEGFSEFTYYPHFIGWVGDPSLKK